MSAPVVVDTAPTPGAGHRLLVRLRARFRLVLGGGFLALAVAPLVPRWVPPVYTSQAVVLHRELVPTPALLGRDAPEETQRQRGARLRDTVLARSTLEGVLLELDLFPEERHRESLDAAMDAFVKAVDCKVAEDTFTVRVSYVEPELARRAAQRLAESLVAAAQRYRFDRAVATRDFIGAQREAIARDLRSKETALARFLAEHPEFAEDLATPSGQTAAGASIRARQRRTVADASAIASLERRRAHVASRLDAPEPRPEPKPVPADPGDEEARERLASVRRESERAARELADLRSRYTDAHPDVVSAERRKTDAARSLREAERRVAERTGPVAEALPQAAEEPRSGRLARELHELEENLHAAKRRREGAEPHGAGLVDLETEWVEQNRAVLEARERHAEFERRFFQAAMVATVESGGTSNAMTVVDPAFVPKTPSARPSGRTTAVAAFAIVALAVALAVGLASRDDRVADVDEVAAQRIAPIVVRLAALPEGCA